MAFSDATLQKFIAIVENLKHSIKNSEASAVINLTNDLRIESRENGIWIVDGERATQIYSKDTLLSMADSAWNADEAGKASYDSEGITLKGIDIQEYGDCDYFYIDAYDGLVANIGVANGTFEVVLPDECEVGYTSKVFFTTPSDVDEYYFTANTSNTVYFKGDHTNNGEFTPEADTRYTMNFEYDGVNIVAYVSGVPANV